MKPILSLLAAFALLGLGTRAEPPSLEVGQPFPDLALPSVSDGTPMSIADFRGRKVVLHVFASW